MLDPAATETTAKCKHYYTPETDGLLQSWDYGGAVFCNPPYGREIGKWVEKAYNEAMKIKYPVVLLIPARTDTAYFHDYTVKLKYALFAADCILPMNAAILLILPRFRLWWLFIII